LSPLGTIEPVLRTSLVATVVERIRDYIEKQSLRSGDRLPGELEWAERLGVSRPVVREAIGRLHSIGLVEVSRGRGRGITVGGQASILGAAQSIRAAVATSPNDARQVQEFRIALEVHAARLAARVVNDEQLAELESLAEGIDRPGMKNEARIAADLAFHRRVAEIADNAVILNALAVSQELIVDAIRENWRRHRGKKIDSRAAHRRLIAALRSHDADAAQKAMLAHLDPDD
jgi:GntR family transcriptional repressor for pyruvate dehydrogenase complex